MAEEIVHSFVEFFKNKIPDELLIFIISMLPILELRGGLIAAALLDVNFLTAFPICVIGNMVPIPFVLLFIRKIEDIFKWNKMLCYRI